MSDYKKIYEKIITIPAGSVASYGAVSASLGMPKGARMVGWALGALQSPDNIPWHRVVNRAGRLSIIHPHIDSNTQKIALEQEGVLVNQDDIGYYITNPKWHTFAT
jgi:methylated-DNA-protein-cysteine methyltransferase related protein